MREKISSPQKTKRIVPSTPMMRVKLRARQKAV